MLRAVSLVFAATFFVTCSVFAEAEPAGRQDGMVEIFADIPYAGTDNPRQMLDLMLPTHRETTPLPVIVFIHGGGWRGGNKSRGMRRLERFVRSGRYAGISVGYRLSDEARWPNQIHDCKAAIRWIRAHAEVHGLDPDRIGVWGTSAGGHLVAMLGTSGDVKAMDGDLGPHTNLSSRVACVVDFFGPTDFLRMNETALPGARLDHDAPDSPEALLIGGPIQTHPEVAATANPITYVTADDPPFLIVHGTHDPLVSFNQSELLHAALTAAHVASTFLPVDGGGHGKGFGPDVPVRVNRFFDQHLRGEAPEPGDLGASSPTRTVKVFVLTGQSNMEGKGLAAHLDTYREDPLIKGTYAMLKEGDGWAERDDVWITYPTKHRGAKHGPLTVGYGTKGEASIGPEFGFGHIVGEALDAPVVLIKVAWGGKSLAVDFRPPGAGLPEDAVLQEMLAKARDKDPGVTLGDIKARYGSFYRQLVAETREALATLDTAFPHLNGCTHEIAGIVWHQGFNDVINGTLKANQYRDYTQWLVQFIKDLRRDLDSPGAPFVIGELSTGGIPSRGDFQRAQAAAAEHPEFAGNVAFVPTAEYYDTRAHQLFEQDYWKGTDAQKAEWETVGNDRPYHYLGSGKTYYLKGKAFAEAMLEMMGE